MALDNKAVDAFILDNLPGTFGALHGKATQHFGEDTYRKVDQRLQSLRKRGLATFHRNGKHVVWSALPTENQP